MKVLTNLMFRPAAAALALIMALPAWATELVMVEQPGCTYCARWDAEIAPAYPKTAEGRFAPLRREQLRALPDDVQPARRVMFTPTFLIVEEGREIARLEGYPGANFFWPVLSQLLQKHTEFEPEGEESK